jgi:hypothetical protein
MCMVFVRPVKSFSMVTTPPTPDPTPAKPPRAKLILRTRLPRTPSPAPLQLQGPRGLLRAPLYECENTGNDHLSNHLSFSQLAKLSVELASIFRHLSLDYINVPTPNNTDTLLAQKLLQRDVKCYCRQIAGRSAKVQRNTVLRALVLFSSCSYHATQYLEHSADDRIAWLVQLDTSGVWLKPSRIILRTILRVIVRFCTKVYSACTDSRVQSFALLSCNRSLFPCSKTNATYIGRAANRL